MLSGDVKDKRIWRPNFFDKSLCTVENVSADIIKGIARNKMYIITQIDGKFAWYLKRLSPSFFLQASFLPI